MSQRYRSRDNDSSPVRPPSVAAPEFFTTFYDHGMAGEDDEYWIEDTKIEERQEEEAMQVDEQITADTAVTG